MQAPARAVVASLTFLFSGAVFAQVGPSDPQLISAAPTSKLNVGNRKLGGHVVGTVQVGVDGRVTDVLITENTAEPSFESQVVKLLQSARFRPAIDAEGRLIPGAAEIKVELRVSTGAEPKPTAAKSDPQLTEREKARIRKMTCKDFTWEWDFLRDGAGDSVVTEFMPRIAVTMYAALRTEAGEYVDAKVWKTSAKSLRNTAEQCREQPQAPFFEGVFKSVMDEAVPK